MGLGDFLSSRVDNWRAHPFQNALSTLGGAVNPALGLGLQQAFGRYNDSQLPSIANNEVNQFNDRSNPNLQASIWDKPLNGSLGDYDRNTPSNGPMNGMQDSGGDYSGGMSSPGGFDYGQMGRDMSPPNQSPSQFVQDILGNLGPNPNQQPSYGPLSSFNQQPGPLAGFNGGGGSGPLSGFNGGWNAWQNPGGGTPGIMNNASSSMLMDFAAPTNGDWMARLQSHIGAQGPNQTAKQA